MGFFSNFGENVEGFGASGLRILKSGQRAQRWLKDHKLGLVGRLRQLVGRSWNPGAPRDETKQATDAHHAKRVGGRAGEGRTETLFISTPQDRSEASIWWRSVLMVDRNLGGTGQRLGGSQRVVNIVSWTCMSKPNLQEAKEEDAVQISMMARFTCSGLQHGPEPKPGGP